VLHVSAVPGAPAAELARSPAAAQIGGWAAASGLRLAHFEHRVHLPTPEFWLPEDRPDLAAPGGHLAEHKYGQHRNDGLVGSFNPGHRAKWTAHELCHGLAGFAWRPGAPTLFHALSARLSEVVPVALWYFFDEIGLRRCPQHTGPLFGAFCAACEAAALAGPRPLEARDEAFRAEGLAFVDRELAAVAASRRLGRPVTHRHATLDLMSDALAYAVGHQGRLNAPEFHTYIEYFHPHAGTCHSADLDGLAHRVEALAHALAEGTEVAPWPLTADQVVAQDVGWRLLQVSAECEGEVAAVLDALAQQLAADPAALAAVCTAYQAATEDWFLPPAEEVFAVGYDLPGGLGRSPAALTAALAEALPGTEALLGEALPAQVAAFVQADDHVRGPAPRRFAAWLAQVDPGPVADVARYEAACAHPHAPDPCVDSLGEGEGHLEVAEGVEVLDLVVDPTLLLQALEDESVAPETAERPTRLGIRQRAGGEVLVAELSAEAAAALSGRGALAAVPEDERTSLMQLGFLRSGWWRI